MTIIKKYCEKCHKRMRPRSGWYFQVFNRGDLGTRGNGFLCETCFKKFEKWMDTR